MYSSSSPVVKLSNVVKKYHSVLSKSSLSSNYNYPTPKYNYQASISRPRLSRPPPTIKFIITPKQLLSRTTYLSLPKSKIYLSPKSR